MKKNNLTTACLAFAAVLLTSSCVRAQASAENPYKTVAAPQADAEWALVQAKKLMAENKQYSQKITAVYQGVIATLQEARNAEKTKTELDQNKPLIESTTTEEQAITADWQQAQTVRIAVLETNCTIARDQLTNQQTIWTNLNSQLDLFKKSGVDVETLIPLYNQVIENVKKASELFQKTEAEQKTYLANMEKNLADAKTKYGRK